MNTKTEAHLEPWPTEVTALLRHEKARPAPAPEACERVMVRLNQSMMSLPIPTTGAPTPASMARAHMTKLAGSVAIASVVGALAGAALHSVLVKPEVRVVTKVEYVRADPVPALTAPQAQFGSSPLQNDPQPPPRPQAKPQRKEVTAPKVDRTLPEKDQQLAAERALLEQARTALSRDRAKDALEALRRSTQEYPSGLLREEHDALMILALVADGQRESAQQAAAAFRQQFPHSVLLRSIRLALEGQ
jgi:hypothetical protein